MGLTTPQNQPVHPKTNHCNKEVVGSGAGAAPQNIHSDSFALLGIPSARAPRDDTRPSNVPAPETTSLSELRSAPMKGAYQERTTVNGIEISVAWDRGYQRYTILFPQIDESSEQAKKLRINDQAFQASNDPAVAKKVFDYAVAHAPTCADACEVYDKASKFFRTIRHLAKPE